MKHTGIAVTAHTFFHITQYEVTWHQKICVHTILHNLCTESQKTINRNKNKFSICNYPTLCGQKQS